MINLSNRHCCEVEVCAETSVTTDGKVAVIIVVFELLDRLKNFKSVISTSMNFDLLIFLVKFLTIFD